VSAKRLREGTRLSDVVGRFEAIGEKVTFTFADSGESVRILENLALERVARVLPSEGQKKIQWSISGTVTEYNGGNYLLLTKASQSVTTAGEAEKGSGIGTPSKRDYPGSETKRPEETKRPTEKSTEPAHDRRP
jgi:hypothetical protein